MAELDTSIYRTQPHDQLGEINKLLGVAQGVTALQSANFDLARKHMQTAQQVFGAIAADPTLENVASGMSILRQVGAPPDMIAEGVREFTQKGNDPAHIRSIASRHIMRLGTVEQQLQGGGMAPPAMINNNNKFEPYMYRSGPNAGVARGVGPTIPVETSPGERMTPDPGLGPNNEPISVPRGPRYDERGYPRPSPAPVAPSGPIGGSGGPTLAPGKGDRPLPAGAMVTGQPPGAAEASRVAGGSSGEALAGARTQAMDFRAQVYPLEQAIPALEKLGTKGTGPGTETVNHIKSFLLSSGLPGMDPEKIKTYDEAKKYLTDFVNRNGNTGTNDKLAAAFAGNPSVNISNAAAVDVAKAALSLRRMKQAQLTAFEKSGLPESEFAKFASKWNVNTDPRVYGFDMMSPDKRKALIESLPKGKREMFMMDVQDAVEHGVLGTPGAKR